MPAPSSPSISIIIPTFNEAANISAALQSVELPDENVECLVVDGGSEDETCAIVARFPEVKLIVSNQVGRGSQMNAGARAAKGELLIFLHADCRLPKGAVAIVQSVCAEKKYIGGSFCLAFDRRHWVLDLCSLASRINHPLATYGDQAQFVRRDAFVAIGGFQNWALMEDLEIQYRLRRRGRLTKIRRPVVSSDRRYRRRGPLAHQIFNIGLVALYLAGVSPERLAKWYRPQLQTG